MFSVLSRIKSDTAFIVPEILNDKATIFPQRSANTIQSLKVTPLRDGCVMDSEIGVKSLYN